jgi:hypothetical protein
MINVPFQLTAARLQLPSRPEACKKHKVAEPTNKKNLVGFSTQRPQQQQTKPLRSAWRLGSVQKPRMISSP